jgi:hypothetical protein
MSEPEELPFVRVRVIFKSEKKTLECYMRPQVRERFVNEFMSGSTSGVFQAEHEGMTILLAIRFNDILYIA